MWSLWALINTRVSGSALKLMNPVLNFPELTVGPVGIHADVSHTRDHC